MKKYNKNPYIIYENDIGIFLSPFYFSDVEYIEEQKETPWNKLPFGVNQ